MTHRSHPASSRAVIRRGAAALARLSMLGAVLGVALGGSSLGAPAVSPHSVVYSMRTMGTYANVTIVTGDSAATAPLARIAQRCLARVDSLMSNWTTTSEVARINREAGKATVTVEPEVARVIATSLEVWRGSDHTFDITIEPLIRAWGFIGGPPRVPSDSAAAAAARLVGAQQVRFDERTGALSFERPGVRIDLGGIAKGYAVDVAAESLAAHGVANALVDLTGNMFARGHSATGPGWRIGIRDPRDRLAHFATLTLSDEAISTSGKYEQFVAANGDTFGHIMDPRTGRPSSGLLSVTVVSKSAFTCDAWDTPLFVLGPATARELARAHDDFDAVLVTPGRGGLDTVWVEAPLAKRVRLDPAARGMFHVVTF